MAREKIQTDCIPISSRFLSDLEAKCGSKSAALALRKHISMVDFLQKWELPLRAHMQLKQQEVTNVLAPLLVTPSMLTEVFLYFSVHNSQHAHV